MGAPVNVSSEPLSQSLREAMVARGITYRELSRATGLSAGYLCHISHGTRPVPSTDVLEMIAAGLGVPCNYFLEYRVRAVVQHLESHPHETNRLYRRILAA